MSRSRTALTLAEYFIATLRFDVVDMGASSVPPCCIRRRHVLHAAVELDAAKRRLARVPVRLHRTQLSKCVAEQRDRHRQRVRLAALEALPVAQRVVDALEGLRLEGG